MSDDDKKTIRQRIILWSNRIFFDFKVKRERYNLRVMVPGKYKPLVKTLKILLTLIGLFSAFIVFQSVFIAFLFGLAVYALTTILEKIIFTYSSLYVHPFPSFTLEQEKWLGVFWGYAKDPKNGYEIPLIGLQFSDEDYARKIYDLLLSWALGKHNDKSNNVKLGTILTDDNSYTFFCYPSIERETAKAFYGKAETDLKKESKNDIHNRLAMMLVLAKSFDIIEGSYFPTFRKRYRDGVPYLFQLGVTGEDGSIQQVSNTDKFIFYNLKILDKRDLTRKDIEYDMLRLFG
jgi:hypothetical protein